MPQFVYAVFGSVFEGGLKASIGLHWYNMGHHNGLAGVVIIGLCFAEFFIFIHPLFYVSDLKLGKQTKNDINVYFISRGRWQLHLPRSVR